MGGGTKFVRKQDKIWSETSFFHFLKCGPFVFLKIALNDSLQQCLTSSRGKSLEKIFWGPNLGQRGQHQAQNYAFCHFLIFGSLVFLEIAYNNSLQQCMPFSRVKLTKKIGGPNFGQNEAQN